MGGRQIGVSGDNVKGHHGGRGSWSFSLLGVKGLRTVWKSLDKQQGAAAVFKQGSDAVTSVFLKKTNSDTICYGNGIWRKPNWTQGDQEGGFRSGL